MQRNFEIYANEIEWRKASDLASQEISQSIISSNRELNEIVKKLDDLWRSSRDKKETMEDFDKRTEVIQIRELIKEKAKIAAANQKRSIEKTKYLISLELFDQFFYF